MTTVLLSTLGSAGDVHPVLAVALALRRQGHRPVVLTSDAFATTCAELDLEFEPLLEIEHFERAAEDPDLWHPWRGFGVLARSVIVPAMKPLYERIAAWSRRTDDLVVASSLLCFGARLAQERLGVPMASLHLQPVVLRSRVDTVGTPHLSYDPRGPRWRKDLQFFLADTSIVDPVLVPELQAYRDALGLPRVRRLLDGWVHSPQLVVGLWPEWYAPVQPDWPAPVQLTDFPLFDPGQDDPLPPELARFLGAGRPPVLFTAGSANLHTDELFAMAARITSRHGERALLVGPRRPAPEVLAPPHVLHVGFTPFAPLLPHCRAIVHHGGIGTTARALDAGLPQVLIPLGHDQPDNALRVRHLGAGTYVPAKQLDERRLEAALLDQWSRPAFRPPARHVGTLQGPDAAARAITRIAPSARA